MELNYDKYKGIIMKLFAETQHDLGIFASYSDVSVSLDHNDFDESKFFAKSKYIISPYNFNLQESFIIKIPTENILLYVYERPENS